MSNFTKVHVVNGFWHTYYEPISMPGSMVRVLYSVSPVSGSDPLRDGSYNALIPQEGILRIVTGGEYFNGTTINYSFSDYKVKFLEEENNEFLKGYTRAYTGKRKATNDFFSKQSLHWQDGYRSGLCHRREIKESQSFAHYL